MCTSVLARNRIRYSSLKVTRELFLHLTMFYRALSGIPQRPREYPLNISLPTLTLAALESLGPDNDDELQE